MNYQRIYDQIIDRASNRQIEGYKEVHHIIPKCLGGTNEHTNLAELTAREHFLCHWLLSRIYPDNRKIGHAFWMMCNVKDSNQQRIEASSRAYDEARERRALLGFSKEHLEKRTASRRQGGWFKDVYAFISKRNATMLKNGTYKHSAETIAKLKQPRKPYKKIECPHCNTVGIISNIKRFHLDNCELIVKKPTIVCPHCKKEGKGDVMKRWHFDRCKLK